MKNIYIIAGGPGDPELITVKAKNIINNSDFIFSSSKYIPEALFNNTKSSCVIFDTFSKNYDEKIELAKKAVNENKIISFVNMGDSFLYGMIGGLVDRLEKNHLDFEIIPGVSSLNASSAILKRGFTGLGVTNTLVCTSLKDSDHVLRDLDAIASLDATVAIFMAVNDIDMIVEAFRRYHIDEYPISVVSRATWKDEKIIISDLANISSDIKKHNISDGLVLLGEFLFKQYDYILEREFEERMRLRREKDRVLSIAK